jgi:hypothetical protein
MHPRVIAFGAGVGPHDLHQLRAHYLPVHGEHCRDIASELEQEREAIRLAEEEQARLQKEEEEEA